MALSGHNRANAAKLAGLAEVPAIVKVGLSEAEQYDKTCCQGKRNDIIRELELLGGNETESTCGHNGHRLKSRDPSFVELMCW